MDNEVKQKLPGTVVWQEIQEILRELLPSSGEKPEHEKAEWYLIGQAICQILGIKIKSTNPMQIGRLVLDPALVHFIEYSSSETDLSIKDFRPGKIEPVVWDSLIQHLGLADGEVIEKTRSLKHKEFFKAFIEHSIPLDKLFVKCDPARASVFPLVDGKNLTLLDGLLDMENFAAALVFHQLPNLIFQGGEKFFKNRLKSLQKTMDRIAQAVLIDERIKKETGPAIFCEIFHRIMLLPESDPIFLNSTKKAMIDAFKSEDRYDSISKEKHWTLWIRKNIQHMDYSALDYLVEQISQRKPEMWTEYFVDALDWNFNAMHLEALIKHVFPKANGNLQKQFAIQMATKISFAWEGFSGNSKRSKSEQDFAAIIINHALKAPDLLAKIIHSPKLYNVLARKTTNDLEKSILESSELDVERKAEFLSNLMSSSFYSFARIETLNLDVQVGEAIFATTSSQEWAHKISISQWIILLEKIGFSPNLCEKITMDYMQKISSADLYKFKLWIEKQEISKLSAAHLIQADALSRVVDKRYCCISQEISLEVFEICKQKLPTTLSDADANFLNEAVTALRSFYERNKEISISIFSEKEHALLEGIANKAEKLWEAYLKRLTAIETVKTLISQDHAAIKAREKWFSRRKNDSTYKLDRFMLEIYVGLIDKAHIKRIEHKQLLIEHQEYRGEKVFSEMCELYNRLHEEVQRASLCKSLQNTTASFTFSQSPTKNPAAPPTLLDHGVSAKKRSGPRKSH